MAKTRVQAIIIQDGRVLFGYGKGVHYFIGGGLDEDETPEHGVLRELREEANIGGTVRFRIDEPHPNQVEGPGSFYDLHITFLVDIGGQVPVLGYDPEEKDALIQDRGLACLEFIPLDRHEAFTAIDIAYFTLLMADCRQRGLRFQWTEAMGELIRG